jgi:hypothetical protein
MNLESRIAKLEAAVGGALLVWVDADADTETALRAYADRHPDVADRELIAISWERGAKHG